MLDLHTISQRINSGCSIAANKQSSQISSAECHSLSREKLAALHDPQAEVIEKVDKLLPEIKKFRPIVGLLVPRLSPDLLESASWKKIAAEVKADPRVLRLRASNGETLINKAIKQGDYNLAEELLEHGAALDLPNSRGEMPLELAILQGYTGLAELMVSNDAPLDVQGKTGKLPLLLACERKHTCLAETMVAKGSPFTVPKTSLMQDLSNAVTKADDKAGWLIRLAGFLTVPFVDIDDLMETLTGKWIPLELALTSGVLHENIERLWEGGTLDVSELESELEAQGSTIPETKTAASEPTSLEKVFQAGDIEKITGVLNRGANADERFSDGKTPLEAAMNSGDLDIIELVLNQGANANGRFSTGKTPLGAAEDYGDEDLTQLLLDHGAN